MILPRRREEREGLSFLSALRAFAVNYMLLSN